MGNEKGTEEGEKQTANLTAVSEGLSPGNPQIDCVVERGPLASNHLRVACHRVLHEMTVEIHKRVADWFAHVHDFSRPRQSETNDPYRSSANATSPNFGEKKLKTRLQPN